MRLHRVRLLLPLIPLLLAACPTKLREGYCEQSSDCPTGQTCDSSTLTCSDTTDGGPPDLAGSIDLSTTDLADPRLDLSNPDLLIPDLAPMCRSAADCTDPAKPLCGMDGNCRACAGNADDAACATRSAATPKCEVTSGACVECLATADCGDDGEPICAANACRACNAMADDAQCATRDPALPKCDSSGAGACVACLASADCSRDAKAPVCDAKACRACRENAECQSGVCQPDGSCAAEVDLVHVDNEGGNCAPAGRDGTRLKPYCQLAEALASLGMKKIVKVAGSATAYNAVTITTATTVRVVGPGMGAVPAAEILEAGKTAINLALMAGASDIALEELVIRGDANGMFDALSCTPLNNAQVKLAVHRSTLRQSGAVGLRSTSCDVTLTRSTVTANQGGGVSISGGTYSIANNLIVSNGGTGVTFAGMQVGEFSFNTVYRNGALGTNGGMDCGSTTRPITASIVVGNASDANTQFFGKCQLSNVVTGTDSFLGATQLSPEFVNTMPMMLDAHLKAASVANRACCVDKIAPGMGLPAIDVDGAARPMGAGLDIGAHEVE